MEQPDNIIHYIRQQIAATYEEREASAIAREVAERCFGITLTQSYAGTARNLSTIELQQLEQMTEELKRNVPVQYVTKQVDFMGHTFHVSPGVLIPRPETESLVRRVLNDFQDVAGSSTLLDAGTGSGCIAISLQISLPQAHIFGLDLSSDALRQASGNAKRLFAPVRFLQADLLRPDSLPQFPLDALISNPPYIRESEKAKMESRVKDHEPEMALFVPDNNALIFYHALALWGKTCLKEEGKIYVETNSGLAAETAELFLREGYRNVELLRDQFEKDRIIVCKK